MHVITIKDGNYYGKEHPKPVPAADEVLIKVHYAGVNRADLFQLQGKYPLPEHGIPGLEVSGEIVETGNEATGFQAGDQVCALLAEGGYAEYVKAPAALVLPVPASLTMAEAACLPEACFTAWLSLIMQADMQPGETVLIHGGGGGIGNMAIMIANMLGGKVFATAGSEEKCEAVRHAGAVAIHYPTQDFTGIIHQATGGKGVDIILDMVGGDYFERNLAALARDGRLCIIAFLKGSRISANISPILLKHLQVTGSTLRSRPLAEKAAIAEALHSRIWNQFAKRQVKPLIDRIFPLMDAQKALDRIQQGLNIGKILIKI